MALASYDRMDFQVMPDGFHFMLHEFHFMPEPTVVNDRV